MAGISRDSTMTRALEAGAAEAPLVPGGQPPRRLRRALSSHRDRDPVEPTRVLRTVRRPRAPFSDPLPIRFNRWRRRDTVAPVPSHVMEIT
jgi:hypothetical protein